MNRAHAKTFAALALLLAAFGAVVGLLCAVLVEVKDLARVWTALGALGLFVMALGIVVFVYLFAPDDEERMSADEVQAILDADEDTDRGLGGYA